jgi:hypothetical protein
VREADGDSTISDWRWLRDEVAFVAEHVHSEPAALEYLLDRLHRSEIEWCSDKIEMHFLGGGAPESDHVRIGQLFFWRRYVFVKPHEVDLVNNSAVRTGAAILGIRCDDKGNPQPIYKGRWSLTMRATLIRLRHSMVVRCLQRSKLMPSPLSLVPEIQSGSKPVESPPVQEPEKRLLRHDEVREWLAAKLVEHPLPAGRQKTEWCRLRHKEMEADFEGGPPWSVDTLRRRLNDPAVIKREVQANQAKQPGKSGKPGKPERNPSKLR